ncbi:hypothetical protein [Amycolatopsis thermoflava]|uniref:hypothetical protein n=1 Tax=Amycolatopsis thermoflava TaxID=84480 RepID=UPI003EBF9908
MHRSNKVLVPWGELERFKRSAEHASEIMKAVQALLLEMRVHAPMQPEPVADAVDHLNAVLDRAEADNW